MVRRPLASPCLLRCRGATGSKSISGRIRSTAMVGSTRHARGRRTAAEIAAAISCPAPSGRSGAWQSGRPASPQRKVIRWPATSGEPTPRSSALECASGGMAAEPKPSLDATFLFPQQPLTRITASCSSVAARVSVHSVTPARVGMRRIGRRRQRGAWGDRLEFGGPVPA